MKNPSIKPDAAERRLSMHTTTKKLSIRGVGSLRDGE